MEKFVKAALFTFLLVVGLGCGNTNDPIPLCPAEMEVKKEIKVAGQVAYRFESKKIVKDKSKLRKFTHSTADQFEAHFSDPLEELNGGRGVPVCVMEEKFECPLCEKEGKVKEVAYPNRNYSQIWHKKLFHKDRGIPYTLGKHFVFEIYCGTECTRTELKKAHRKADYDNETGEWSINQETTSKQSLSPVVIQ